MYTFFNCPDCGTKLRAPTERIFAGHRPVCPVCKKFAAQHSAELRDFKMSCSKEDKQFWITFARQKGEARFRVRSWSKESPLEQLNLAQGGRGAGLVRVSPEALRAAQSLRVSDYREQTFSSAELDTSGLTCPYCKEAGRNASDVFVSCGGCKGFFCDGARIRLPDGRSTWACPCGASGVLQVSNDFEVRAAGARVAPRPPRAAFESAASEVMICSGTSDLQITLGERYRLSSGSQSAQIAKRR